MSEHELRSIDGNASFRLKINEDGMSFTLHRGERESCTAFLRAASKFIVKEATLTSLFAVAGEASLSIQSQHILFDVVLRDPSARAVELKIDLGTSSWYGLGHMLCQRWPLETASLDVGPFYPFDNGPTGLCTVTDPTLISSAGTVLKVSDKSKCLHLGLNAERITDENKSDVFRKWSIGVIQIDTEMKPKAASDVDVDGVVTVQSRQCFDWPYVEHPWQPIAENPPRGVAELQFQIGATEHARAAADAVLSELQRAQKAPKAPPPEEMMRDPIWTTWVRYREAITQQKTIEFAEEIASRGLPRSVMEIDDRWSTNYGDLDFDPVKFPDPKSMVSRLHDLGFLVTLWVIPFANLDSNAVLDESTRKFFVHTQAERKVGELEWWQPTRVAALDLTNIEACDWFVSRLKRLQTEFGIDGYKFDSGEPNYLPIDAAFARTPASPSEYTRLWLERVASKFHVSEIRACAQGSQPLAPLTRLLDRLSTWTLENGLASVLTGTLTSGLLGFPFVLPDMVGGNGYMGSRPDAELMVRWAQLSACMPALQYSIPPWELGEECESICASSLAWRRDLFWPRVQKAIADACEKYTPIVRPMWWVDARAEMRAVYDQFMLGDDMLVAPIVKQGEVGRNVLLPRGTWQRVQLDGVAAEHETKPVQGGASVHARAALDDMPVFLRVAE